MIQLSTGVVGIGLGSFILTKFLSKHQMALKTGKINEERFENYRVSRATSYCIFTITGATIAGVIGSLSANLYIFLILLGVSFLLISMSIAPAICGMLFSVPQHLKGQTNAVAGIITCVLGNFLAPVIIGWLFSFFDYYWGMVVNSAWAFWSILCTVFAWNVAVIYN